MTNLDSINISININIKMWSHFFVIKGPSSQSHGFSSGYVWMWELDY